MIHKIVEAPRWAGRNGHRPDYDTAQVKLAELTQDTHRAVNPVYVWKAVSMFETVHIIHSEGHLITFDTPQPQATLILEKIVVDAHLEQLRRDFDAKLAAAEERHKQKVNSIFEALRGASQDALREASLRLLEDVVTNGMIERLPERLSELINQSVEAAFLRARDNA